MNNARVKLWLLIASIACAGLVGYFSVSKQVIYFSKYAFFKDPSEYLQDDVNAYESTKDHSSVEVAGQVAKENFRNPIRSMLPLVIWPSALKTPYAHLITSIPYLIIFLYLTSLLVYRRFDNLTAALIYIPVFSAAPLLYNSFYGFAAYWLDLHGSLLFVSSMVLLLFYYEDRKPVYITGFALVSSLEVLGRYNNVVYLFFAGLPILIFTIVKFKEERKKILLHIALAGFIIAVLSGWFLIGHFQDNMDYGNLGYAANFGIVRSAKFFFHAVVVLLGRRELVIFVLLAGVFWVLFYQNAWKHKDQFFLSFWIAAANFIVLHVLLGNGDHTPSTFYIITPSLLFLIAPFPVVETKPMAKNIFITCLAAVAFIFVVMDFRDYKSLVKKSKSQEKIVNEAILSELKSNNERSLSGVLGGFSVANLSLESYYGGGPLLKSTSVFAKYDVAWIYYYGTKNVLAIEPRFIDSLNMLKGYVVTFADTAAIDTYFTKTAKVGACAISRAMALRSRSWFESSPDWKLVEEFKHPVYGRIKFYHKTAQPS